MAVLAVPGETLTSVINRAIEWAIKMDEPVYMVHNDTWVMVWPHSVSAEIFLEWEKRRPQID